MLGKTTDKMMGARDLSDLFTELWQMSVLDCLFATWSHSKMMGARDIYPFTWNLGTCWFPNAHYPHFVISLLISNKLSFFYQINSHIILFRITLIWALPIFYVHSLDSLLLFSKMYCFKIDNILFFLILF